MAGRSIRIFLVDGEESGLLTAEVMNWSGKLLVAPRTKLADLAKREEIVRTGVYILAGPDPENPSGEIVYIGEGDSVFKRLGLTTRTSAKSFGRAVSR
ncbi:hypothetical protein LOC67_10650 [Stieleria sp. JC731]|uniref:hypothetical protein n=1 Tax=Pirellulaceae TaxID=2691357 RepID=UPI001E401404|nr:hypothetical protein [Stieleria sp. JC731]MCC9601004.1 hypothetical protein [Stieleria sp. JC731]